MAHAAADALLDEMVWAVDHLDDPRMKVRGEAFAIIGRARDHVANWHAERARRTIDLREHAPLHATS